MSDMARGSRSKTPCKAASGPMEYAARGRRGVAGQASRRWMDPPPEDPHPLRTFDRFLRRSPPPPQPRPPLKPAKTLTHDEGAPASRVAARKPPHRRRMVFSLGESPTAAHSSAGGTCP